EMFRSSPQGYYSLIFMDIQMPVLDGNQAAEKIRSLDRPDAKTVPIIAMTANAFIEDFKTSKEHGMNGHVTKPLDVTSLTAELCKWLPEYKKNKS
ncbi:MAG: response regulator, partial [Oscillospiraceae bacterium]